MKESIILISEQIWNPKREEKLYFKKEAKRNSKTENYNN